MISKSRENKMQYAMYTIKSVVHTKTKPTTYEKTKSKSSNNKINIFIIMMIIKFTMFVGLKKKKEEKPFDLVIAMWMCAAYKNIYISLSNMLMWNILMNNACIIFFFFARYDMLWFINNLIKQRKMKI